MTDEAMIEVTQADRDAAASVFDVRARKAEHPASVTIERHHAKVIRAGEGDNYDAVQAAAVARHRLASQPAPADVEPFQARVQPWLLTCFGEMISGDREERNHRFLEEALELVQACGCTASEAHHVDYTFGRPIGEPAQEVGGVMVTLAALCLANGLDMHAAAETELARIWTKVEAIRAKQAAKPKHSPLPEQATFEVAAKVDTAGYQLAFYELAKLMGIGARPQAPGHVWRNEMLPRLLVAFPARDPALDVAREEAAHLRTIDERDAAESALSDAYRAVCGREPEWSNNFGYADAVREMGEATTPAAPADVVAMDREAVANAVHEAMAEFDKSLPHSHAQAIADAILRLTPARQSQPVAYVSPGQLAAHTDAEGEAGRYLPVRKTPVGNFVQPLYAAPAQPVATPAAGEVEPAPWASAESPSRAYGMGPAENDVDYLAYVLFDAFAKAEPREGITRYPASYWATFAEMARAVLSALTKQPAQPVAGEIPADVVALVRAARAVTDGDGIADGEAGAALDAALERFSARVCYDDDGGDLPEAHATPCTCTAPSVPQGTRA